jgi:ribonuclease VapC
LTSAAADSLPALRSGAGGRSSCAHRYSKGRHPAALDYGDCLSYATSVLSQPLLFVGDDFTRTDIEKV